MRLKEIKSESRRNANKIAVSEHYIVFCTGRRARICDRRLRLLHVFEKLSYVYDAYISPDEKHIALMSSGAHFHMIDTADFSSRRVAIRTPWNGNTEGRGCFSFDSSLFYVVSYNEHLGVSAIRAYDPETLEYEEHIPAGDMWISNFAPAGSRRSYVMTATDRRAQERNEPSDRLIWFDGTDFEIVDISACLFVRKQRFT